MSEQIAFLGPEGTFSERAALDYAAGVTLRPCPNISAVAKAVVDGSAIEGVVPIENSLEGSVTDTLDILIQESTLFINRELVLPIQQCLLVKEGTQQSAIKNIYSHPQAFGQCRIFLDKHFKDVELVASFSTVAAVKDMLFAIAPSAAIANMRAAEVYGVDVLIRGIEDNLSNATRFVILAKRDHVPTGDDKTSLCLEFSSDEPGSLHKVLGEFAKRDINLTKVESRPTKHSLGEYRFLIDCEGHRQDDLLASTIERIHEHASTVRIFGSYPRWIGEGQ